MIVLNQQMESAMKLSSSIPLASWKATGKQAPKKGWHEFAIIYCGKRIKQIAHPVNRLVRRCAGQPIQTLYRRAKLQIAALGIPVSGFRHSVRPATAIHRSSTAQAAIDVSMALQQIRLASNTPEDPALSALAERYARIAQGDLKEWAPRADTHRHQEAAIMSQALRRLAARILASGKKPDPDDMASFAALLQARARLINSMCFNSQEDVKKYAEYGPAHQRYAKRAEDDAQLLAKLPSPFLPSIPLIDGTRRMLAAQEAPVQPGTFLPPFLRAKGKPQEWLPLTPLLAQITHRTQSDQIPPSLHPELPQPKTA